MKQLQNDINVLVNIHAEEDGPGSLARYLWSNKCAIPHYCKLYKGDQLPPVDKFDAVVSLGGFMNVDEENKYPFVRDEIEYLKNALEKDVPVFGICLGAQLLAKAAGANVYKAEHEEIGWHVVQLTEPGLKSPIFRKIPRSFNVLQWHKYTFDIPQDGKLLASSKLCPNQAFTFKNSLAVQFHPEITMYMLSLWAIGNEEKSDVLTRYDMFEEEITRTADCIYGNFFDGIGKKVKTR